MENLLSKVVQSVQQSKSTFTKFITANDAGATGGHQAGFHIHKSAWSFIFDQPGEKGANKDKFITIRWQDDFETSSRFIYYGVGTRNEYRLTRFGRGFPFLTEDNVGDLLVISKKTDDYYEAFVLQSDDDIEDFFTEMNISSTDTNGILPKQFEVDAEHLLLACFNTYINSVLVDFPPTVELAVNARNCYLGAYRVNDKKIIANPDKEILNWIDAEFQLFKAFETNRYADIINRQFQNVEELIVTANTILNRRKSRAGKSLEHHLSGIFNIFQLNYDTQATTEGNKKPDFLFPNSEAYHNLSFNDDKLIMLASKTTCKDRWRQILNEADRIKTKHLFTLQQGISKNQLEEMYKYNVRLIVPKPYLSSFPPEYRSKILTLDKFVADVKAVQM
ncbi:type II restriction endonuclease [Gelidibacter japonicus]|uniref:type II restriction endonuclease n=1 Tax=Gelidibacter japonicus TaxID=1962232 RepID=UPI002AFDD41A|nr:type II restriction endonuclease [Gelidibacter japonicus]